MDVILTFNGKSIGNTTQLIERVRSQPVGADVEIDLIRKQERTSLKVTMGERSTAIPLAATEAPVSEGVPRRSISEVFGVEVSSIGPADKSRLGLDPRSPAVLVTRIRSGSPAANSLQPGDLIHGLNRQAVDSREQFLHAINSIPLDRTSDLLISRNGHVGKFVLQP
jgi:serine protease Do